MRFGKSLFSLLLLGAGLLPVMASADVTIGGTNSNNVFPFGLNSYAGEYQQIYASSAFPGLLSINSVAFSSETGFAGGTRTENVTISLSNTASTPAAPSSSYAANKGSNFTTVYNGPLNFTSTNTNTFDLNIPLTAFTYDPALGNLLLDVVINSTSGDQVVFQAGTSADTGRVFNSGGNGSPVADGGYGLLTRFGTGPAAVPEPGSVALLVGMGLSGAGFLVRRRKQARQAA